MTEIKFGHVEGPGHGREYPVAASQYFARRGGKFIYLVNGAVTLCATDSSKVMGWAETPKDTSGEDSWASSSTAKKDKIFVITGMDDVYELPYNEAAASLDASLIGKGVGLVNATIGNNIGINRTAAAGTAQMAKASITATPLTVIDIDKVNKTVQVKIKNNAKQAL